MSYYHTDAAQRAIAREHRRLQPSRFDSICQENRERRAYQDAWKIPESEAQQPKARRTDSRKIDLDRYYQDAWKS